MGVEIDINENWEKPVNMLHDELEERGFLGRVNEIYVISQEELCEANAPMFPWEVVTGQYDTYNLHIRLWDENDDPLQEKCATILHEVGHAVHYENVTACPTTCSDSDEWNEKLNSEWLRDVPISDIEFVANTFQQYHMGEDVSDRDIERCREIGGMGFNGEPIFTQVLSSWTP